MQCTYVARTLELCGAHPATLQDTAQSPWPPRCWASRGLVNRTGHGTGVVCVCVGQVRVVAEGALQGQGKKRGVPAKYSEVHRQAERSWGGVRLSSSDCCGWRSRHPEGEGVAGGILSPRGAPLSSTLSTGRAVGFGDTGAGKRGGGPRTGRILWERARTAEALSPGVTESRGQCRSAGGRSLSQPHARCRRVGVGPRTAIVPFGLGRGHRDVDGRVCGGGTSGGGWVN